jgi:hypothetical protein
MMKLITMRWVGHVARMRRKMPAEFWLGYPRERGYLKGVDVIKKIILKWNLE